MWLFYVLIILTIFLAYIINTTKPKGAKQYLKIMFCILAFLMMFKGSSVGNDTDDYANLFQTINYSVNYYGVIDSFLSTSRFETGFVVLNRLIGLLFDNSQWLFIFTGLFIAFAFGRFFYQYSLIPWLSVFMFLTLQFFDLSMSGLRQILAIAVLTFAYDFMIKRKLIPFVILVLVASSFHGSAITFLFLYPLSTMKVNLRFLLITSGTTLIVFAVFSQFLNVIELFFPQYVHYLTQSGASYSNEAKLANVLMLLLFLILFIILFYLDCHQKPLPNFLGKSYNDDRLIVRSYEEATNIHKIAIWLGVLMLFLSLQGTILNRFKFIFAFPILVAYPSVLMKYNNPKNKLVIQVVSCIVFFAYIVTIYYFRPEWQSTYPFIPFWDEPY